MKSAPSDGKPRTVAFNFRCHAIGDESYEYAGLEADISELRWVEELKALLLSCHSHLKPIESVFTRPEPLPHNPFSPLHAGKDLIC